MLECYVSQFAATNLGLRCLELQLAVEAGGVDKLGHVSGGASGDAASAGDAPAAGSGPCASEGIGGSIAERRKKQVGRAVQTTVTAALPGDVRL